MYFDRVSVKREAKQTLRTARPSPLLVTLVYLLLTSGLAQVIGSFIVNPFFQAASYIVSGYDPMQVYAYVFGGGAAALGIFVSLILMFYNSIMAFGYAGYTLRLSRGEQGAFGNLIDGFNLAVKVVVLDLLTALFITLWTMLFIIPGIIAVYRYSMAVYCLLDDPEISPMEALRRSKQLMIGQKFNFFVVQLSFFGWSLLAGVLATGAQSLLGGAESMLGYWANFLVSFVFNLWLTPYMNIVFGSFYNNLIGYTRPADTGYRGPELEF